MQEEMNTSLRYRVFYAVILVGIFMSFSSGIINFILGLDPVVTVASFAWAL
ncbi:MAG: hypothetical protein GX207_02175 [Peptococcaceae bacterium]|nr:hypothetical protein [Peptococcaceae bacterium]